MRSVKSAKTAQSQSKFLRFITTPFRVLGKARDFYVQSLTNCAGRVSYGGAVPGTMPRSFSTASSSRSNTDYDNEDFRELIRAASMKSLGNDRIDLEMLLRQQQVARQSTAAAAAVKRSVSVGMGRIDEDTPCDDFGGVGGVGGGGGNQSSVSDKVKNNLFYPRSKSYAVTKKSLVF